MRLGRKEKKAIISSIKKLDPNAEIYLYGSRTDPKKKGGDIDILILSSIITKGDIPDLLTEIFEHIEEQKIDLLIARDTSDPFVRIAFKTGVKL